MTIPRPVRVFLVFTPALALLAVGAWFAIRPTHPAGATARAARLVVLVVFDQMRGDYPQRWASEFGQDGFEKLKAEGVWYNNCHLPYACSSTGPGHASISTGAPPSVHGIVENRWFLRGVEKPVYCSSGDRPNQRVPPADHDTGDGLSPERLLVPAVGDSFRTATHKQGRVFSLSLKDRSAVLLGGKDPSGAYCFDTEDGQFHTSTYYRERVHPWVESFNASGAADRWVGRAWERLGSQQTYDRLAGPDDVIGEGSSPASRVFPHALPADRGRKYYSALEVTPFGNDLLWEFAKAAIVWENLGREDAPDLLLLSYSSNDLIGHKYGPDSHEVMDVTLRSDRLLASMTAFLDDRVGAGKYAVVVTADHGVCPLPEAPTAPPGTRRVTPEQVAAGLGEALDTVFGQVGRVPGRWIEKSFGATFPWLYLDRRYIEDRGIPVEDVERYAEQWLGNRPAVQAAFGRSRLQAESFPAGELGRSVQLAFHPDRCGDVCVVTKPYILCSVAFSTGTNHGTPHEYDTHVPVLAYGAGVPKLGQREEAVSSLIVAPLVCRLLGIEPPPTAAETLPEGFSPPRDIDSGTSWPRP
jgi:arylsulfatase A-like enzyme